MSSGSMEVPTSGPSRPSAPERSIIRRQSSSERRMSIDSYREQSIPKALVALHAPVPPPKNAHSHAQGIVHFFGGGLSLAITSVLVFQFLRLYADHDADGKVSPSEIAISMDADGSGHVSSREFLLRIVLPICFCFLVAAALGKAVLAAGNKLLATTTAAISVENSNAVKEDESIFRDGIELTRKPVSSNFSMSKVRNIHMATPTFIFEEECVRKLNE